MKRSLLLAFTAATFWANAQCPVLINGQGNGAFFNICASDCFVYTASGAQTYTWVPVGGNTVPTGTICPSTTTTYTLMGSSSGGTCTDTNIFTIIVNPNPTLTPSASSSTICAGASISLMCMGATTYTWAPSGYTGAGFTVTPTSSTVYTVCATDMNGCVGCGSIAITVNPSPTVTFTMTPNGAPQVWDAVATYTGGTGPYTYYWDFGDGSPGATTAYPSHTYTAAGWYNICCTLTDGNGCSSNYCVNDSIYKMNAANAMITVNVQPPLTGIIHAAKEKMSIYPNPANNEFVIETGTSEQTLVQVFDLSGRKVLTQTVYSKTIVDVSSLTEGLYTLSIKTGEKTITKKLTVVR